MRLLTHNMLSSNIKGVANDFRLRIDIEKVVEKQIEWKALIDASRSMGYTKLPDEADPSMLDSDDFLQKFHHALLELHLEEGALVCPETGRKFPVNKRIPNMLLHEDEVPIWLIREVRLVKHRDCRWNFRCSATSFEEKIMLLRIKSGKTNIHLQVSLKLSLFISIAFKSTCRHHSSSETEIESERITKIINDHPFPDHPLHLTLCHQIPPVVLSPTFVENVLGRLFATHSNGLKAFEFFKYSLLHSQFCPSSDAFEKTLHILTRMCYFDKAWELMEEIRRSHLSLLTLKSMSIMLSRIARFQSYEDTLEAFERMEKKIFAGKKFGTDEFNILLRAFCTQRQMKEARSVFNQLHSQFSPNAKTMNILLLGFKESGDVTAVELFYHEMVRRGFKPNNVTYNIRIDAYCKKGCFGDGLRLFEEMKQINCSPTLETITTLIHGAGVARNTTKAKELFNEICMRNLLPDIGAYNALMSSLIRSRDMKSAASFIIASIR
ncbi:unnamed protein product [Ilex paraguariensis]|uniref:Pentatricopeptide repeat-containing protein n=1 Tax=Ilex paraguariensis TaxID=185542 RepID=A0ABC8RJF7_9AQUA